MVLALTLTTLLIIHLALCQYRIYLECKKTSKLKGKLFVATKELERKNQIISDCQCVLDDFDIIVEILEDNFIEEEINEMIDKKRELREKDLNKFLNNIRNGDE